MKTNFAAKAMAFAASLLIIIAVLFTSLQLCMNDEDWYYAKYESYGTAQQIGIPNADITRAIMQLVDYMEGRVDSIQLTVSENGKSVEMYNERETLHMLDVRTLYQAWRSVRDFGIPACAVLFIAACALTRRGMRMSLVCRSFIAASVAFGAVLAALGVWVAIDFNGFWTAFHHLFFDNDLWLLSYSTDRMIRICPAELFRDIVVRFALIFLIPFAVMLAAAVTGEVKTKRAAAARAQEEK